MRLWARCIAADSVTLEAVYTLQPTKELPSKVKPSLIGVEAIFVAQGVELFNQLYKLSVYLTPGCKLTSLRALDTTTHIDVAAPNHITRYLGLGISGCNWLVQLSQLFHFASVHSREATRSNKLNVY